MKEVSRRVGSAHYYEPEAESEEPILFLLATLSKKTLAGCLARIHQVLFAISDFRFQTGLTGSENQKCSMFSRGSVAKGWYSARSESRSLRHVASG
jgi:hypothetical protein